MQHTRNSLLHCCGTCSGFSLFVGRGAGRGRGKVGLWETGIEGHHCRRGGGQQGAIGAIDVALTHQGQVCGRVLLHRAQARPQVRGPRNGGQVRAKRVARRHEAPPRESVGAGAEGGVQALGARGQRCSCGDPVLSERFDGLWSGAGQVVGRGEAQEVGQHQVLFTQEAALVIGSRALSAA